MSKPDRATALEGPVAVLYQAMSPPDIGGIRKPKKVGGYADSGADIAFVLRRSGTSVLTPSLQPREQSDLDWVFPDDPEGIQAALKAGARVLWANTILFSGHPIEAVEGACLVVGQRPEIVQAYDDKWAANLRAREAGCKVARSFLVARQPDAEAVAAHSLTESTLLDQGYAFPLVVKPVRGRGSQGVQRVDDLAQLLTAVEALLSATTRGPDGDFPTFGDRLIVEEYLAGEELTVTVMPPGSYRRHGTMGREPAHWTLPPVVRFGHTEGIAPYSGVVAIVENSRVMTEAESSRPNTRALLADCGAIASAIAATAPLRVDCRMGPDGTYRLFDINMKPNMTGPGRRGRENQDSLVCLAARSIGWSYADILHAMLGQAW